MKFGMIGAGRLSRAIASHALKADHEVVFSNSRGPETLTDLVDALGPQASAGTVAEAGAADFVVLAVSWAGVREALSNLPDREGRILIDATNQWKEPPPESIVDELEGQDRGCDPAGVQRVGLAGTAMGPCVHSSCLHDLEADLVDRRGQAGAVGGDTLDDP